MTATEVPTLYDVLEVDPESSLEELRAAVERARETYGQESLAVYALVDEGQLDTLRAKLDEAATVLLDPARRASYDRSIGRLGPATLWGEDDDEDALPLPPLEAGPHATGGADLELEDTPEEAEGEESPRQHALALELSEAPGAFGRGAERGAPPEAPAGPHAASAPSGTLLSGDWAAAVPPEQQAARPIPAPAREAAPPPVKAPDVRAEPTSTTRLPPDEGAKPVPDPDDVPAERAALPPALGLRLRAPRSPPEAEEPVEPPAVEPPRPRSAAAEYLPELPTRQGESKPKVDIPSDAEFNGELLRRVRESYGLSLQQVAERTRITRIHLENVEADRYDRLPATVYLRGILVNLARELRLDPARVSKTYLLAAQRSHGRGP